MRKFKNAISLITFALVILVSTNVNAQTSYSGNSELFNLPDYNSSITISNIGDSDTEYDTTMRRKWWQTALVDAAGALGGAGSVASLSGMISTTNPIGWGWMAVGGIIGGVGASVARVVPDGEIVDIKNLNQKKVLAPFTKNDLDTIGNEHNSIIIGFANSGLVFNVDNYINYIKSLKNPNYDKVIEHLGNEYFKKEFNLMRELDTYPKTFNLISSRLPESINKKDLISELEKATNAKTNKEFINFIKELELNYINNKGLKDTDNVKLKSFFSTLRHSAELWVD